MSTQTMETAVESTSSLTLSLISRGFPKARGLRPGSTIIAGWTGRDRDAIEHHIRELEAVGVKRPRETPLFYRVAASLATTATAIEVAGATSSGEAEVVLMRLDGDLWVGLGSDHTDRQLETVGVTIAKQICAKPIANIAWRLAEVRDHWDRIELRSFAMRDGERRPYQEGTLAAITQPWILLEMYEKRGGRFDDGAIMFTGTLPAIEGVYFSDRFEIELHDPVLARTIRHAYSVIALPIND